MAKVEIEERAFNEPALRIASSKHKVPVAYILGCIAIVWRASQQIGVVKATGEEILAWLDTDRFIKPEVALRWLISADLIRSEEPFLESSNNNLKEISFFISGNPVAVARTKKRIENARVAANSRYHKEQSCETHAARMPYNTTSIQVDKKTVKQEDKKETKTVSSELVFENKKPTSLKNNQPTDGSLIWSAYSAAYRQRYGIEPKRNATTSAQCSQLVKRLGVKDAIEVVGFYLGHNSDWYIKCSHSIGQCLKDSESLYSQMMRGEKITTARARQIDSGSEQAEIFERVTRRLEEKYEGKKS
jgi:hypothetical protein